LGHVRLRQLGRNDVYLFNRWRSRQKIGGLCHKRLGDASRKVGLASLLGLENVEDAECGLVHADGEPGGGFWLIFNKRLTGFQKIFYFGFFAGFCF